MHVDLLLNREKAKRWVISSDGLLKAALINANWLFDFSEFFQLCIRGWMAHMLGCELPERLSGVSFWILDSDRKQVFTATRSVSGELFCWPYEGIREIEYNVLGAVRRGLLETTLELAQDRTRTWGGMLHRELALNRAWVRSKIEKAALFFSASRVHGWVKRQMQTRDADSLCMLDNSFGDVVDFLKKFPGPFSKSEYSPWKKLCIDFEAEGDVVLSFVPRWIDTPSFKGVKSDSMDRIDHYFGNRHEGLLELTRVLTNARQTLNSPPLDPIVFFSPMGITVASAAPTTVKLMAKVRVLRKAVFYVNVADVDALHARAAELSSLISRTSESRGLVNGVLTQMSKLFIDETITVYCVNEAAMKGFDHSLSYRGGRFKHQNFGETIAGAIGHLIILKQKGEDNDADVLTQCFRALYKNKKVKLPVINDEQTARASIYYVDYNKSFSFKGKVYIPDQCIPITYTKDMHEEKKLLLTLRD